MRKVKIPDTQLTQTNEIKLTTYDLPDSKYIGTTRTIPKPVPKQLQKITAEANALRYATVYLCMKA